MPISRRSAPRSEPRREPDDDSDPPPGHAARPSSDYLVGRAREKASSASDLAEKALEEARSATTELLALRHDVAEIKGMLGGPPSQALDQEGRGLIGAVSRMQETLDRLVRAEEARAKSPASTKRRRTFLPAVAALVGALGGAGGVATLVSACRGATPAVQTSGAPPRP